MAIVSVRALPYEVMADYLRGDNPLNPVASAADAHDRTWVISVTNSAECPLNAFEGWEHGPEPLVHDGDDRIALSFDDVEPRADGSVDPRYVYFDAAMARRVCDFVRRAHGDGATRDLLLVNCHAGVSRSGAIADFARTVAGVDYTDFKRANAQVVPNAYVRRLLFAAWEGEGSGT